MSDPTAKTSRWSFTAYEGQWCLFKQIPPGIAEWGWQLEKCPTTGREHYQGYIRTQQQQRFAWLHKLLPGVRLEVARNWDALVNYCKKVETRVDGAEQVHVVSDIPTQYTYAEEISEWFAQQRKQYPDIKEFNFEDWTTEQALLAIDARVRTDIANGRRGVQWIASNPNWKVMWKAFWKECLLAAFRPKKTDRQTDAGLISPAEYNPNASQCSSRSSSPSRHAPSFPSGGSEA